MNQSNNFHEEGKGEKMNSCCKQQAQFKYQGPCTFGRAKRKINQVFSYRRGLGGTLLCSNTMEIIPKIQGTPCMFLLYSLHDSLRSCPWGQRETHQTQVKSSPLTPYPNPSFGFFERVLFLLHAP